MTLLGKTNKSVKFFSLDKESLLSIAKKLSIVSSKKSVGLQLAVSSAVDVKVSKFAAYFVNKSQYQFIKDRVNLPEYSKKVLASMEKKQLSQAIIAEVKVVEDELDCDPFVFA